MASTKWLLICLVVAVLPLRLSCQEFVGNVPAHGNSGRIDVGEDDVWLSDGASLWHTHLKDLTWSSSKLPYHDTDVQLRFVGSKEGWILIGGRLFHTEDGDRSWTEEKLPSDFEVEGFSVAPNGTVWVFGSRRGRVVPKNEAISSPKYTTEELANGLTVELNPAFNIYDKAWTSLIVSNAKGAAKAVYFVENRLLFSDPWLLHWSDDEGKTWHGSPCFSSFNPGCQDESPVVLTGVGTQLWCGTTDGSIQHSEDGGKSWATLAYVDSRRHDVIERLQFLTQNTGFALSDDRLFRTDDGGKSWKDLGLEDVEDISGLDRRLFVLTKDRLYRVW